jgi:predicted dehydrogenase
MAGEGELPRIAMVGAGIFARTQYIPRLREIAHLVVVKAIWSRTQVRLREIAHLVSAR